MAAVRRLSLVLDLDTGQFTTRITDATGKLRQLDAQVARSGNSLKKAGNDSKVFGEALRDIHHSLSFVHVVMLAASASVGAFTSQLIKANAETQKTVVLLTSMSKGANFAQKRLAAAGDFKFLTDFAEHAPYSMGALTDVFVKLKSVGIEPTTGAMQALVDGVALFGGSEDILKRAAIALQQMGGKGVVSMEELRQQLGEAMPTAMAIFAKAANMGVQDFVKQVSLGKVQFDKAMQDKVFAEMERQAHGAADRMMHTFDGQANFVKTQLTKLAREIGGFDASTLTYSKDGFMSVLANQVKDFGQWLNNPRTKEGAKQLGKDLVDLLTGARNFLNFVMANAEAIKMFGSIFLGYKTAELTIKALKSTTAAMQVFGDKTTQLISKTAQLTQAQIANANNLVTSKKYIEAAVNARKTMVAGITSTVTALKAEVVANEASLASANNRLTAARRGGDFNSIVRADAAAFAARNELLASTTALTAAEGRLAVANLALAETETVAAAATKRLSVSTGLLSVTMKGMKGFMAMIGGWPVMAILAAAAAFAVLSARASAAASSTGRANERFAELQREADETRPKIEDLTKATDDSADASHTAAGAAITAATGYQTLGNAAANAAEQVKYLNTTQRLQKLDEAKDLLKELERKENALMGGDNKELIEARRKLLMLTGNTGQAGVLAQQSVLSNQPQSVRDALARAEAAALSTNATPQMRQALEDARNQAAVLKDTQNAQAQIRAEIATREQTLRDPTLQAPTPGALDMSLPVEDPTSLNSSSGSTPKHRTKTSAERIRDEITKLNSAGPALNSLINTMEQGSQAAEEMRSKIAAIRDDEGDGAISAALEKEAIAAAVSAENLGKAYDIVNNIFGEVREQSVNAAEALLVLDETTNPVDASTEKYARTLAQMRAEFVRLTPASEETTAALVELDKKINQATDNYRFAQLASQVRDFRMQLDEVDLTHLNPDLQTWDDFNKQAREFAQQQEAASKIADPVERERLLKESYENQTRWNDQYTDRVIFNINQEAQTQEEAVMTADNARQAAHDREIARIMDLTDATNVSADKQAEMAEARTRLIAASQAKFARDSETPLQKMLREWQDTTTQMKTLQGDWMSNFMDIMKTGEGSFKDLMVNMVKDFLWMKAQAKLADVISGALNVLTSGITGGTAAGTGVTMNSGLGTGTGFGGVKFGGGADASGMMHFGSVPVQHAGGMAGISSISRMVSMDLFNNAPKFHKGRIPDLKPGDLPAIIHEDEGVFTPEQMRAMGGRGGNNVQINMINESGQPLEAQQNGGRMDGEKFIVDVVVSNLNRRGPLRDAMKGLK